MWVSAGTENHMDRGPKTVRVAWLRQCHEFHVREHEKCHCNKALQLDQETMWAGEGLEC